MSNARPTNDHLRAARIIGIFGRTQTISVAWKDEALWLDLGRYDVAGTWVTVCLTALDGKGSGHVLIDAIAAGLDGTVPHHLPQIAQGHHTYHWTGRLPDGLLGLRLKSIFGWSGLVLTDLSIRVHSRFRLIGRGALRQPGLTAEAVMWRTLGKRVRATNRLTQALTRARPVGATGKFPLLSYLPFTNRWRRRSRKGVNPLFGLLGALPPDLLPYFERLEPYDAWLSTAGLTTSAVDDLRDALGQRAGRLPTISLITPVYNTPEALLRELVQSVTDQIYDDWELCLVDDCSPEKHIAPLLQELASLDERIRLIHRQKNGGISAATNDGASAARGEIIAFLDHDDLITADCLAEIVIYYADNPEADIVYSDDDKTDLSGRRFAPQFKPDWSPTLLLSYMYMSHIFTVRRSLFSDLGGFRAEFDGSQDYDFALRATERARHVGHVPRILYHWRVVPGSTAASGDAKPQSFEAGRKAVEQALQRRAIDAEAIHPPWALAAKVGMFAILFPDHGPDVTIIIPTYNQHHLLKACIESLNKTTYKNVRILVADNESDDRDSIEYMNELNKKENTSVVRISKKSGKFNFAALINDAVQLSNSKHVLLLNNDTQVINPRWLSQMMGLARMPGVGCVGARLYFGDDTIQHAGVVHGYNEGLVGHAFRNASARSWGYMGFMRASREYSAVTAACLLVSRSAFDGVEGMNEDKFAVAYNDVDFGYRLVKAGMRCVYCSEAELYHFEGKSRPKKDDPREVIALRQTYGDWQDRWYNPNLSLENEFFEPGPIRLPVRREAPTKVVFASHNLNFEGAPIVLLDLVLGLVRRGVVEATVVSPVDGPLREVYERAGVSVHLIPPPPLGGESADFLSSCDVIGSLFESIDTEVVVANTLQMFYFITIANRMKCGAVWCQHESEPWRDYYDYLSPPIRAYAYAAFAQAYRVTYVADATRRIWSEIETRRNFRVIRHGIPPERLEEELSLWTRDGARSHLRVEPDKIVVLLVGTICARKGQFDLVGAIRLLSPALQQRLSVFVVGAFGEPHYAAEIAQSIDDAGLDDIVTMTGPADGATVYFKAADIFVCTSRVESAPRVIVEAMAFGLPIVTTPVFGIPEIVDENVNALFYQPGDTEKLSNIIDLLARNDGLRSQIADKSPQVLESRPSYEDMLKQYGSIVREAAGLKDRRPALAKAVGNDV